MSFTKNPGRFAGLLYLIASIPGPFALVYVPGKLIVHGNAAATAHNIAAARDLKPHTMALLPYVMDWAKPFVPQVTAATHSENSYRPTTV